ncbi:MAG: hypothetical protein SWY16_08140 [Cyanobacteriota bacterium]|nr:hypothetical protein [Cyanobacteriota bacterium]
MPKGKKGFQPGNKFGAVRMSDRKLATRPICFKPYADQWEKLRGIPNLVQKLREYADCLIEETEESGQDAKDT